MADEEKPAEFLDSVSSPGLGSTLESFPQPSRKQSEKLAIDRLKPNSQLHDRVLNYLLDRLQFSEREMSKFYSRWNANEKRVQGYIKLSNFEQDLVNDNDDGKPAAVTSVVVPYSYATMSTIVTYGVHAFGGRNPIFQVGTYGQAEPEQALLMETWLQYNSDHSRFLKHLYQFLQDINIYGVGILMNDWEVDVRERTVFRQQPKTGFLGADLGSERIKTRELRTAYAGNSSRSIDPYRFFPDPRVAMSDVAKRGEWVFWREYMGKHELLIGQAQGKFKYINAIGEELAERSETDTQSAPSQRSLRSLGESNPGSFNSSNGKSVRSYIQIDQGTVEIIPKELGLGPSTMPQKWVFTIGNKNQIIQAERFDRDHDMHPVSITEPYGFGYSFGQMGLVDLLGPLQDTMSWFVNSHIYNVRASMNNQWIVDPSMVEMQDLNSSEPGKTIRLKRAAFGQDVRSLLQQFDVRDVTANHVQDLRVFTQMADGIAAVSDNIRGLQAAGGRKTATEVRTSGEAASSRLASQVRLISAQALTDFTAQQVSNTQQYLDQELWVEVTGPDGRRKSVYMSPEHVTGDFYYPIHDGTLPTDRVAMLDVWREIFQGLISVPELAARYDLAGIFEFMAEMGGASNFDRFKVGVESDASLASDLQAGNVVPIGEASNIPGASQLAGNLSGTEANPRRRLE